MLERTWLKKPITKRQEQALETKNRIYTAAINLMDRKGFDNITIADISKKAGVSVGAFYHYFNSKHEILAEIFRKADEYFSTQVKFGLKGVCTKAVTTLKLQCINTSRFSFQPSDYESSKGRNTKQFEFIVISPTENEILFLCPSLIKYSLPDIRPNVGANLGFCRVMNIQAYSFA